MYSEIVVIGGGLNGLICALSLAHHGFEVTLIEQKDLSLSAAILPDGRAYAISSGSAAILNSIGLWQALLTDSCPINKIRVSDNDSKLTLDLDHQLLEDAKPLGYMIYSHLMYKNIYAAALDNPKLKILSPAAYKNITKQQQKLSIELDDGKSLDCQLLIAADGKNSPLRDQFGIASFRGKYQQTAIVCTVAHELHHQCLAQEKFFPIGPFASLPLQDGYHSSIVWTEPHQLAKLLMSMNKQEFSYFLEQKFGTHLGKLAVIDKKFSYPLSYCLAKKYYAERFVLIGDSAHSIHPLAGQGLNLGIADISALISLLCIQRGFGLDLGSTLLLANYQKTRQASNMAMFAITDSLNRLFTCNFFPTPMLRRLGMEGINQLNPAKRFLMHYAGG